MSQDYRLSYQEQLQRKMEEYHQAEAEGMSRTHLLALYKQIKDIQLKTITSSPHYNFWSNTDNQSVYNR